VTLSSWRTSSPLGTRPRRSWRFWVACLHFEISSTMYEGIRTGFTELMIERRMDCLIHQVA